MAGDRCEASSWKGGRVRTPYGPGGYNRCALPASPPHGEHRDEWGNVFVYDAGGRQAVIRHVEPLPAGWRFGEEGPR